MSDNDGTCEYVLDPDDPETWGGEEGDECHIRTGLLNEDDVWTCPHDPKGKKDYCIFHLPVEEKEDTEVIEAFFEIININTEDKNAENSNIQQFIGAKFGNFDLFEYTPEAINQMDLSLTEVTDTYPKKAKISGILDFTLAEFQGHANFTGAEFQDGVQFQQAYFDDDACFREAKFGGHTVFRKTKFNDEVEFVKAQFGCDTDFGGVIFDENVTFWRAEFEARTMFSGVEFNKKGVFGETKFLTEVDFEDVEFKEDMTFKHSSFRDDVNFQSIEVRGDTNFRKVNFEGECDFRYGTFKKKTDFRSTYFEKDAYFWVVSFGDDIEFRNTQFKGYLDFRDADIDGEADFHRAEFNKNVAFPSVEFGGKADFRKAEFEANADFKKAEFEKDVAFSDLSLNDCEFDKADLTDAEFTDTSLKRASFESALLSRATLLGADFRGARLADTVLGDIRIDEETKFLGHSSDDSETSPHTLSAIRSRPACVYDPDYEEDNEHADVDKAKSVYRALEELGGKHARPRLQARSFVRRQDLQKKDYWDDATADDASLEERLIAGARWSRAKMARATLLYGESPWRVIAWSLGIIFSFALLYPLGGWMKAEEASEPLSYSQIPASFLSEPLGWLGGFLNILADSVYYSTLTYTALGFGDFQPEGLGRLLTTVETGLGAVMLALLVFILGRRAAR